MGWEDCKVKTIPKCQAQLLRPPAQPGHQSGIYARASLCLIQQCNSTYSQKHLFLLHSQLEELTNSATNVESPMT
eukprot:4091459-Amphidinium_carterae.1